MRSSLQLSKMWKVVIAILALSCVVESCIYKKRECPDYTVVEQHPDYEIRSYPALTWISTSEESRIARVGQYKTFMRLFNYINGENDRNLKINMTVPVRMKTSGEGSQLLFEMSFMVPSDVAADAPIPTDKRITVSEENPTMYAVRTFPGYVWRQNKWAEEAEKLTASVRHDDTIVKTSYYRVGYDAPFDLFDRRNEIWMVKRSAEEEANEV